MICWEPDCTVTPYDDSIRTYSGLIFWPLNPHPALIGIGDIAHALAHQCRFGGHSRAFYSVAQHSVRVSEICATEDALWGLLHDASEAYLVDVPAPLKQLPEFAAYRRAEERLQALIMERFGLSAQQPASVTAADLQLLMIEMRELFDIEPGMAVAETKCWSPAVAEERFLERFRQLTGRPTCELRR